LRWHRVTSSAASTTGRPSWLAFLDHRIEEHRQNRVQIEQEFDLFTLTHNLAAVIVGVLPAFAGVLPIPCRCRAGALKSGPLATNLCPPGSP
jgi:hypothetical protein